jgi:hypothetical protein
MSKWFHIWWYKFLFTDYKGLRNLWCRIRGHHGGVVWYSSGLEPDMTCKDCGEDLG